VRRTEQVLVVQLHRTKKLNALSYGQLQALHAIVTDAVREERKIVLCGEGSHFCCGGDVIHMYKQPPHGHHYLRAAYTLFLRLNAYMKTKAVVMKGFVMGTGAGFAATANIRIGLRTLQWGFPECANGSLPDMGATFLLGELKPAGVGLYLSLTGEKLSAADCYELGIITHYLASEALEKEMIADMERNGQLLATADQYHTAPPESAYALRPCLAAISRCFSEVNSVEEVLFRLNRDASKDWATRTLHTLRESCPYVTHLALNCLLRNAGLTYSQCMRQEFLWDCNVYDKRYTNYHIGIAHKFQLRRLGRPPWQPATLEQVTEAAVTEFFEDHTFPTL